MSFSSPTKLYHGTRYSPELECGHCHGTVRHERWCITRNHIVLNAYESVLDESKLSEQDRLILHALGASWKTNSCQGQCSTKS